MAIADSTIVSTVDENINPEWIAQQVRISLGRTPFTFRLGVIPVDLAPRNTKTYSHPIRDEIAKATPYTETDLVTSTQITRQTVKVTTKKVIKATFLSIEAVELSMWDEFSNAVDELTQANLRACDDDFLELADDFTNDVGSAAQTMTVRNLVAVHTAYRAQVRAINERPIMYFEGSVMGQLQDDAVTNGAALLGSTFGVQLQDATRNVNLGQVSTFNGVDMVTTTGLPAYNVTGISNMMIARGQLDGAIAMPYQHFPRIDQAWRPENQGWWVVGSFNYEVGIVNDLAGLTFGTRP
jgi:hypothetical protein